MKIIQLLFPMLCLSLSFPFALAQKQGTIKGRVVDQQKMPLPMANITIEPSGKGTVSDINGYYSLVGVPEGEHQITVSYIGYQSLHRSVWSKNGETQMIDFQMESGAKLEEVKITAHLKGQKKALNQQKNALNITNVIASDQVGRFPDANIGDALKRVPGINMEYDQGEARFGHIRGVEPRLSSVTVNGERVPSAEAENRSVQLDLIPSDMVQSIEVSKAITPDMDADAIGGTVNLVTKQAPYNRKISLSLGSGYNFVSQKPLWTGSLVYGDRFAKNKLGFVLSASVHDHKLGSDNIEAEWDYDGKGQIKEGKPYLQEQQTRKYLIQRIRRSVSIGLDYHFWKKHKLFFNAIYNHRDDWENRYKVKYSYEYDKKKGDTYQINRQTKGGIGKNKNARLEDQRTVTSKIGGEHLFGKLKLKWSASYAKASEERPNERYISFEAEPKSMLADISNTRRPKFVPSENYLHLAKGYELDEITEESRYTDDIDKNAKIDCKFPLAEGPFGSKLKIGLRYRGKQKKRDNDFYAYSPVAAYYNTFYQEALNNVADHTKKGFLAGDYKAGEFVSNSYLGGIDLANAAEFEKQQVKKELAGNFDATENITAAYLMLRQKLGKKLSLLAGLRVEKTNLEYSGYKYLKKEDQLQKTQTVTDNYTNYLPNLHLKYELKKNLNIRFAATKSIARPNYYDLVPYLQIDTKKQKYYVGNPSLKPTQSINFDIMAEKYFKSIGLVSAGAFHKNISDFIITQVTKAYTDPSFPDKKFKHYRPINGGDALIFGCEFALQRQLDFLPGFMKAFGVYFNYTYTWSEVKNFRFVGRENEKMPLPGTAKHTFNASISYNYKKLSARLSFNGSSDFIEPGEVGEEAFYDRYYAKSRHLDANLSYAITKKLRLFVEANNLTNQPLLYYQGAAHRIMQAEYYGPRFSFGLKLDL